MASHDSFPFCRSWEKTSCTLGVNDLLMFRLVLASMPPAMRSKSGTPIETASRPTACAANPKRSLDSDSTTRCWSTTSPRLADSLAVRPVTSNERRSDSGERWIRAEAGAECVGRSRQGHRDVVRGDVRVGRDVEDGLDLARIREGDDAALDGVGATAGPQLSTFTERHRSHQGGRVERALQP